MYNIKYSDGTIFAMCSSLKDANAIIASKNLVDKTQFTIEKIK